MATDFIPLGAPELGMTRAEMLEQSNANLDLFAGTTETFFALLFAYVVAMYLAGAQLTRLQYSIANTMYLLVMTNLLYSGFVIASSAHLWIEDSGLVSGYEWFPHTTAAVRIVLVLLSVWFGLRVRQPSVQ